MGMGIENENWELGMGNESGMGKLKCVMKRNGEVVTCGNRIKIKAPLYEWGERIKD